MQRDATMAGVRRLATRRAAEPWFWSGERTIVVAGSRQGAGASTVSALLALACANDGRRTLLIDANERAASQHAILNQDTTRSLLELQQSSIQPEDLLVHFAHNTWLLPCVSGAQEVARFGTAERRTVLRRAAQLYDAFDVVVIDAGSHLDGVVAAAGRGAWRFVAVSNSDALSLASTYAAIKAIDTRWRLAPAEVLINRVDDAQGRAAFDQIRAGCRHFLDRDVGLSGTMPLNPSLTAVPPASLLDRSIAGDVTTQIAVRLLAELDDSAIA